MSDVLFARPADDAGAIELADWASQLRAAAVDPWVDLDGAAAQVTRNALDAELTASPKALVWFGHGEPDALVASGARVLDSGNVGPLSGALVIAIACDAGLQLAGDALDTGVRAFLGFTRMFGFSALDPQPVRTAVVGGLMGFFTLGHDLASAEQRLIAGFLAAEAYHYAQGTSGGWATPQGAPSDALLAWLFAQSNRVNLVVVGDVSASL